MTAEPTANADWPPDPQLMLDRLAAALAGGRPVADEHHHQAAELLDDLGVGELIRVASVAERIVVAATGFHAVAGFFVDGSEERAYILDVMRRAERR